MKKIDPQLYFEAARMLADGEEFFTCVAISRVARETNSDDRFSQSLYREFYYPYYGERGHFWNQDYSSWRQQIRVLALLFMVQVGKTERP